MDISTIIATNIDDTGTKLVNLNLLKEAVQNGATLGGTNYVLVRGNGTPSENWTELTEAYDQAKTMPRYLGLRGVSTSYSYYIGQTFQEDDAGTYKRVTESFTGGLYEGDNINKVESITDAEALNTQTTIIIGAGRYHHYTGSSYYFNASGINLISLSNQPDVIFSSSAIWGDVPILFGGDYSTYIGLNTGENAFYTGKESSYATSVYKNCKGGDYSFSESYNGLSKGTFKDCIGGVDSFGSTGGAASGIYENCTGGDYSFSNGGVALGNFYNCTAEIGSFGGGGGVASGNFYNCTGTHESFGGNGGTASGIFENCKGDDHSFGGGGGVLGGTFTNCIGGVGSYNGVIHADARLYFCKLLSGTFPIPNVGGKLVLCVDGTDAIVTTV